MFKEPNEDGFKSKPLVDWFMDLDRRDVKIGVAGKIMDAATARRCLEHGADFVIIGRAAILHHDFPEQVQADPGFASMPLPVSAAHLRERRPRARVRRLHEDLEGVRRGGVTPTPIARMRRVAGDRSGTCPRAWKGRYALAGRSRIARP